MLWGEARVRQSTYEQKQKKWLLLRPLTSAHDETWSSVFGVDGPRHVGVVGPAQVEVEVTVRLQNRSEQTEGHVMKVSFSHSKWTEPLFNTWFHSGLVTETLKYAHSQACLMSLRPQIPDNPAAHKAQSGDSVLLVHIWVDFLWKLIQFNASVRALTNNTEELHADFFFFYV